MRTIAKRAVQGVVAGALALTGIAATTGTANALTAGNEYVFRNQNTGRCLDDSGDNSHDLLRGFVCNQGSVDGGWQKWQVIYRTTANGVGQLVLKNGYQKNGNFCLDDSGDGNHDLMRGYPCNGSSQDGGWQGWTLW
ncbi:RICIN domain-containing protein [Kitasatospora cinereorecta]|uniref:Ricin B lectin domain-containing protein n=1 Tax=Kitasatospora cinereorecta TaxID=285560 RepID=A0ABW0V9M1_9ACTN